ncbi:MAG: endonuclease/exonuclease/phosphatase family protein [Clostridia bacterium]|nr:endonuclease/exonuclease/phosphatase family protein [Clostridia bacterium]
MKIMTFNTQHCLNYMENRIDYNLMAKTISDTGADLVGLNEMFDEGGKFGPQTKILSELTGLENYYFARAIMDAAGPYGNGLLSRFPLKRVETIMVPDPEVRRFKDGFYETRCILKATLENGLTVLITHFGLNADEQESSVKLLLEHITDEKCVLMGDFNLPPDSEILKPIYERMVDTASMFDGPRLSWPSDKPRIKIDYIFVSKDIKIISADIPMTVASDHLPHIAEIEMI